MDEDVAHGGGVGNEGDDTHFATTLPAQERKNFVDGKIKEEIAILREQYAVGTVTAKIVQQASQFRQQIR